MTARDDLVKCFERHASGAVADMVADLILDKHARELAQKIRDQFDGADVYAADLIDPDKE